MELIEVTTFKLISDNMDELEHIKLGFCVEFSSEIKAGLITTEIHHSEVVVEVEAKQEIIDEVRNYLEQF